MSGSSSADETAIRNAMAAYEAALNASDTQAVMPLYAEDGVFMPQYAQSVVGKAAVRQAYDAVFKTITLKVKFTIAEVVVMAAAMGVRADEFGGDAEDERHRRGQYRRQSGAVHFEEG